LVGGTLFLSRSAEISQGLCVLLSSWSSISRTISVPQARWPCQVRTSHRPGAEIGGQQVLCPDHGLLSWILRRLPLKAAWEISVAVDAAARFPSRDLLASPCSAERSRPVGVQSAHA
jgi:hypothetical protein